MKNAGIIAIVLAIVLAFKAYQSKVIVYTIGDSTMCLFGTANAKHQRGWAQMLPQFFTLG